jgi:hypothetical protein
MHYQINVGCFIHTQKIVQIAMNDYAKTHAPKTVRNAHGLLSVALLEYHSDFHLRTI